MREPGKKGEKSLTELESSVCSVLQFRSKVKKGERARGRMTDGILDGRDQEERENSHSSVPANGTTTQDVPGNKGEYST